MASNFPDNTIHVVAAVLSDSNGRVLLAERAAGTHLAGAWEFPGGKIEPGESAESALRRELHEELDIDIGAIEPLISIPWRYSEKSIVLHAYRVLDFRGEPRGRQAQAVQWLTPDDAMRVSMPPPDYPIVNALRLPQTYAITSEPDSNLAKFLVSFERLLANGVRLVQLRAKHATPERLRDLAIATRDLARAAGSTLLLNGHVELVRELALDGLHLPAADLMRLDARPLDRQRWVAASCHDAHELAHAATIGVDFAVLGPVQRTSSHPEAVVLGWQRFAELCAAATLPVYALGGLTRDDLSRAHSVGAQGIAGISAFWPKTFRARKGESSL